jgi:hypothetical protein
MLFQSNISVTVLAACFITTSLWDINCSGAMNICWTAASIIGKQLAYPRRSNAPDDEPLHGLAFCA